MGIGMGRRGRYDDDPYESYEPRVAPPYIPPPYIIRKRVEYLGYCILKVWYRDATNCGGEKIMVFPGQYVSIDQSGGLEPHFADKGGPIARFHPSQCGWEHAFRFVESLS